MNYNYLSFDIKILFSTDENSIKNEFCLNIENIFNKIKNKEQKEFEIFEKKQGLLFSNTQKFTFKYEYEEVFNELTKLIDSNVN